jgi:hypothetical protein
MRFGLLPVGLVLVAMISVGSTILQRSPVPGSIAAPRPGLVVDAKTLRQKACVVLVTLDGVRWQDVLDADGALSKNGPAMPRLLDAVRRSGVLVRASTSSSVPLSLPGYQALAVGGATACRDNDCPRVREETVADALARRLGVKPAQVAVFASWARLINAASAGEGVLVDAPPLGPPRTVAGPPWPDARWDAETASRARSHWLAHRPRFMHLALLDTDEWAHRGDAERTVAALRFADAVVDQLLTDIAQLPEEERRLTTVLVTTDHGRGPGRWWTEHGAFEGSRDIFVAALGDLVAPTAAPTNQAEVRPTIERLLGLCPAEGLEPSELVAHLSCA